LLIGRAEPGESSPGASTESHRPGFHEDGHGGAALGFSLTAGEERVKASPQYAPFFMKSW
jgi:hypothetical protein